MKNTAGTVALLSVMVIVLVVVAIGVTGAQFEQARANAMQAQATRTMANTQMMTQVMSGIAVVFSFLSGGLFCAGVLAAVITVRKAQKAAKSASKWLPGPNAHWGRAPQTQLNIPRLPALPLAPPMQYQYQPVQQPAYEMIEEYQDEDPLVFGGGWK